MTDYFNNRKREQHIFVLHGLGGGGKTQTALKFVNRCQRERPKRRWVSFSFDFFQSLCIISGFPKYFSSTRAPMALSTLIFQASLSPKALATHTRTHWTGFVVVRRNGYWYLTTQMTSNSRFRTTSRHVLTGISL